MNSCTMVNELRLKARKQLLRVTFEERPPYCFSSAKTTFLETLRLIGIDRLQTVEISCNRLPLISQTVYPQLKDYMTEFLPGWYVNTQSDTPQKYMQLSSIISQLGLDVKIEIGTDFEVDKTSSFKIKRNRGDKLLVQMPDGEFVAEENPTATFIETVRRIGFDKLMHKGYQYLSKQIVTRHQQYNSQTQVPEGYWIQTPVSTKEKYKCLNVMSLTLHLNLTVSII